MTPCPCGDPRPPRKSGHAPTSYRDLAPRGGSVEVAGLRQRFECRGCRATGSVEPVPLLASTRMTPRLAEAILDSALRVGYIAAAEEFAVNEGTVRSVFDKLSERETGRADADMPGALLTRVAFVGRHRIAIAHEAATGALANLYEDPADERLARTVAGLRRRTIHVDHRIGGIVRRSLHASCRMTIHRASAEDAMVRALPACIRRLQGRIGPPERRILLAVRDVLAKRPAAMSWDDGRRLREAGASCDPIREFSETRADLLAVWGSPRLAEAKAAVEAWRLGLGTAMRGSFLPVLSWLDEWGPDVLNAGYGRIPLSAWRAACAAEPHALAHDSARRIVVRGLRARYAIPVIGPRPRIAPGAFPRS